MDSRPGQNAAPPTATPQKGPARAVPRPHLGGRASFYFLRASFHKPSSAVYLFVNGSNLLPLLSCFLPDGVLIAPPASRLSRHSGSFAASSEPTTAMAQKCVRQGCGKTFTDPDEVCRYHPGPPIFHEGQKGTRADHTHQWVEEPCCNLPISCLLGVSVRPEKLTTVFRMQDGSAASRACSRLRSSWP